MTCPQTTPSPALMPEVLLRFLPGPTRKRFDSLYGYRLTYRNPDPDGPCCLMSWEVFGGRMTYQVALERDEWGDRHFHCTCADSVYRGETEGKVCKHVRGLLEFCGQDLRQTHGIGSPVAGRN
jgi:hypothetical protein